MMSLLHGLEKISSVCFMSIFLKEGVVRVTSSGIVAYMMYICDIVGSPVTEQV